MVLHVAAATAAVAAAAAVAAPAGPVELHTTARPHPCLQLGLGNVGIATPGGSFGEGMGLPLWLDDVSCRGDEPRLEACANAGWGLTNWLSL